MAVENVILPNVCTINNIIVWLSEMLHSGCDIIRSVIPLIITVVNSNDCHLAPQLLTVVSVK